MSQRSEKMNRRMNACEGRLQDLETLWDVAVKNTAYQFESVNRKYDRMRSERHREAAKRKKKERAERTVLIFSLLVLSVLLGVLACTTIQHHTEQEKTESYSIELEGMILDEEPDLIYYDCDLPLNLQDDLRIACEESGVDMALALSVIQQETGFRNVMGDGGDSYGYMQVQPRWHRDRMDRLGITDLMDPLSNFRVGCDYLAECLARYPLANALSAYNIGRPDLVPYAESVIEIYDAMRDRIL